MEYDHALHDEADMSKVTSVLAALNIDNDNKENEENQQKTSTTKKKWYEGVVIKPVAFRSLTKRSFYQN